MLGDRIGAAGVRLGMWCLVGFLAGCGGGGGGGESSAAPVEAGNPAPASFSAVFSPATLEVTTVEGSPAQVGFTAALSYTGPSAVYLVAEGSPDVLLAIDGTVVGATLQASLTLRGDLAPGARTSELRIHACADEQCAVEVPGSPVVLPIRYQVKPNLQVQQQVQLRRAGREPAPGIVLPVTIPADAGSVQMRSSGPADVFDLSFDGSAVRVNTRQVRAGEYTLNVVLQGVSDPRYLRSIDVRYVVEAPTGGERALAVDPAYVSLYLPQGAIATQRLTVTRPTWTDGWTPPQIAAGAELLRLRDLGGDQFELTIDASGSPVGDYSGALRFDAGATGGTQYVSVTTRVVAAFYPSASFDLTLNSRSTAADLRMSSPILTTDGVPARWTAASRAPWVRVLRASGQTGVDALEIEIDPAMASVPEFSSFATLDLSIDRPGTLALPVQVSVTNIIPSLQRAAAVLVGDRGRIYVDGAFRTDYGFLGSGALQVDGATLRSAQFIADPRMMGDVLVLALDVDGAVAGQPITVRVQNPLLASAVTLAVEAPARVPRGHLVLPYGAYRAPQYAASLDAVYFSGLGTAYRWAHSSTAWSLSQAAVPGLSDITMRQDEQRLYAVGGTTIRGLDPVSLALVSEGEYGGQPFEQGTAFDALVPTGMRAIVHAADGRAIASLVRTSGGQRVGRGVNWITATSSTRVLADLTASPGQGDPGSGYGTNEPLDIGVGLVASANGHAIVGTHPNGYVQVYRPEQRVWAIAAAVPAGITIVGVSDSGERMVRSDGVVLASGNVLGSLAGVLPLGHVAGGFGLTQDGRYGLVYSYRIAIEGGAERARDANLWVVDMANAPAVPLASAPVVASLALDDAVGCTAALAVGETCRHAASVTLAPGGGSVFVLGPRGLAALPLPTSVVVQSVAAGRAGASALMVPVVPKVAPLRVLGTVPAKR